VPSKALRPCLTPGCTGYAGARGHCEKHTKARWAERNARPEIARDKKFYDSALWKRAREDVLRHEPWCRECVKTGRATLANVVDHIVRLRDGGDRLDRANLAPLCAVCHNEKRSRESRGE
jgi:5-methylcytosine-specific restriction enzyme A